jgi:hypothetical protein
MACERFRDALTDVAAGVPAPAPLEAHLASCEGCQAELHRLRQALAVADAELARLVAAEPSPELLARIRQAVAEPDLSPAWRLGWLWPATAAAATLLVALTVWVGRGPSPSPEARVAVDATRRVIPRDLRLPGPEGSAIPAGGPASAAVGVDGVEPLAPRSAGPVTPPEVRRAGRSLGTRPVGVPRDGIAPEVLVPPGEAEALLRFAAHVRTRVVALDSLLVADLSAPLPELKGVEIQPLEIVPLDPAEASGTD